MKCKEKNKEKTTIQKKTGTQVIVRLSKSGT